MGYWKSKVLPKIKKVFDINGKKAAAAEASKTFDESKETINKEFEEKKEELQPKVLEIYEASSAEIKTVVKERKEEGVKKHSTSVNKFLEDLVKIEFPGSKAVSDASAKYGPVLVSSSVFFVFEKVATFIPAEEPAPVVAAPREVEAAAEETVAPATEEKEVVTEVEEKKEEIVAPPPAEEPKKEVVEAAPVASTETPAAAVAAEATKAA